ncbi:hypothetical protein DFP91_2281 [Pseudorhodoplanes sinuspersici]|nr:hypothetical protein DFP91_2281 [Pseudorhodoplanes sinuspersici]
MPMTCFNCHELIIAPAVSMYVAPNKHRHIWHCAACFAVFEETSDFPMMAATGHHEWHRACNPISQDWLLCDNDSDRYDGPRVQAANGVMHPA